MTIKNLNKVESLPLKYSVNENFRWVIVREGDPLMYLSELTRNHMMSHPVWKKNRDSARLFGDARVAGITARHLINSGETGELSLLRVTAPQLESINKNLNPDVIALFEQASRIVKAHQVPKFRKGA